MVFFTNRILECMTCKKSCNVLLVRFFRLGRVFMIKRDIAEHVQRFTTKMPVLCILGPRQSGKTTLAKELFSHYAYFSLENKQVLATAMADPALFLKECLQGRPGVVFDEFQNCPDLLSAIQIYVDESKLLGTIILTGSQNYLMMESISQSLAGRVALFTLLPLSINELQQAQLLASDVTELIFNGSYPRLYQADITPNELYPDYINTYLERDIRTLKTVQDLLLFKTFVSLCAGRIGQILSVASLANDCGISVATANAWLSLLEASYLIFFLRPHHVNFSKRLIKSPKLYFHDTGIACNLLGIQSAADLVNHHARGHLFENFVISECNKMYYNARQQPRLYFWRDHTGNEIDLVIDRAGTLIPLEIKSSSLPSESMAKGLLFWHKISEQPLNTTYLLYAGDQSYALPGGVNLVSWRTLADNAMQEVFGLAN